MEESYWDKKSCLRENIFSISEFIKTQWFSTRDNFTWEDIFGGHNLWELLAFS